MARSQMTFGTFILIWIALLLMLRACAAADIFCDVDHMTEQQVKICMCIHGYCTAQDQQKLWRKWTCEGNEDICKALGK